MNETREKWETRYQGDDLPWDTGITSNRGLKGRHRSYTGLSGLGFEVIITLPGLTPWAIIIAALWAFKRWI